MKIYKTFTADEGLQHHTSVMKLSQQERMC